MKYIRPLCIMCALFAFAMIAAQAQFAGTAPSSAPGLNVRQKLTTDPSILFPPDREMRILPGDLLRVSIYGVTPSYVDTERVSLEGTVRLNLAGVLKVQDLSLKEAEQAISALFEQEQTFHNAQVSVEVTEAPGHNATVIGAVHGFVPIVGRMRLYDVLSHAGTIPPTASTVLSIERPGNAQPIVVDIGSDPAHSANGNIPIFSGDTITVSEVGLYFVVGAVNKPIANPLNGSIPTTLVQAVTAAGGPTFAAKLDDTKLVRTTGTQRTVINIQLGKMLQGKAEDIPLQTDDIVLIPSSTFKKALSNGGASTIAFAAISLASILVNR